MHNVVAKKDFMTTYLRPPRTPQTGLIDGSVALWLVDINAAEEALWKVEGRTSRLSRCERTQFESSSNWSRTRIRFCAHVALRLILERWLGEQAVRGINFDIDKSGKPYLRGNGLDFSLSYADNMVLIGIRECGAIGVDLESERFVRISEPRRAAIIATADAFNAPTRMPPDNDAGTTFLQAWTRMEAVSKATGMGIGRVLRHFGLIGADKASRAGNLDAITDFADRYDLSVCDLDIFSGLYASLAQIRGTVVPEVQYFPVEADALDEFAADPRQRR